MNTFHKFILLFLFFAFAKTILYAQPAQKEYELAKEAYYDGDYKRAENLFRKVYNLRKEELGENDELTLKVYKRLARTYGYLRENKKALECYQDMLEIAENENGAESKEVASCYQSMGNIYNQMYEPEKGNEAYERALSIYRKKYGEVSEEVGNVYMVIGTSHHKMAAYRDAEEYYLRALDVFKKTSDLDSENFNRIYSNMGYMYRKKGDFEKALDFGKKALEIKLKNYDEMHPGVSKYHSNIGKALSGLNRHEEAYSYMKKAAEIVEKSFGKKHNLTAGAYGELSQVLADMGDLKGALRMQQRSLEILEKELPANHPYLVAAHFSVALIYSKQKKWEEALGQYQIVITKLTSREYRPRNLVATAQLEKANLFFEKKEFDAALNLCQLGLNEIVPDFNSAENDFYLNPNIELVQDELMLLKLLNEKSKIFMAYSEKKGFSEYSLKGTLNTAQLAIELVEKIRKGYQSKTSQEYLNSETTGVFKVGVKAAFKLYEITNDEKYLWQAFEISEKNKASVLWRSLNEGMALGADVIPVLERERINDLQSQLDRLAGQLTKVENSRNGGGAEGLRSDLFDLNREYEEAIVQLENKYPSFYNLRYQSPIFSKEKILEKIRGTEAALVEYFYDDAELYVFLFSEKGVRGYSVSMIQDFEKLIYRIQNYSIADLTRENSSNANVDYLNQLIDLYDVLIRPIKNDISGVDNLVIVPHGLLNYLPFEMLVENSIGFDFRKQHFLIHDYAVNYSWSAALWLDEYQRHEVADGAFIGFAPTYGGGDNLIAEYRSSLTELTYSKMEVEQAESYFGGKMFLKEKASEKAFIRHSPGMKIIHLATHAFTDDENPMNSGLAFFPGKDSLSDGFLFAHEIYSMNLSAEMAVMSACNTGYGKLSEGEGVISLGRAFFNAGCRSVMMTQWLANDQSTAKIMGHFYAHIAEGKNKDEALRQAKIAYLSEADQLTAHPYFWAGMVAVGNMEPIANTNLLLKFWPLALLVLGGLFWFFIRRKN